ncbi:MAG: hypothetical protein IJU50_02330 [Lachnospiraceae bacterium]|nr:hypothetical protein [Lachnospiraceae bacterium]
MLFNSYIFIFLFLPVTLTGYFLLHRKGLPKAALGFLAAASLVFYGYFYPPYALLLVASIFVNYSLAAIIRGKRNIKSMEKICFIIGLLFNIGMLAFFKYYNFFLENVNALFRSDFPMLHIGLPLGISFFTFQQLSFLADVYASRRTDCGLEQHAKHSELPSPALSIVAGKSANAASLKGTAKVCPDYSFLEYAAFVTFFPPAHRRSHCAA